MKAFQPQRRLIELQNAPQIGLVLMLVAAVGEEPQGITFDGTNVWVANFKSNNVTKLLASSGSTVGIYPVGTEPKPGTAKSTRPPFRKADLHNLPLQDARQRFLDVLAENSQILQTLFEEPLASWMMLSDAARERIATRSAVSVS